MKFTVWNKRYNCEVTKFTRQLNVYGIGEELLFPIRLNDGKSETNLGTYLVKTKGFEKKSVKITENAGKVGVFSLLRIQKFRIIQLLKTYIS